MGRNVSVKLSADVSGYVSGLQRAKASTLDFAGQLDKAAKAGKLDTVTKSAGVAGIALGGVAAYAFKVAADFDKAMSQVRAATHASTADIGRLRDAALQAGKDTQYSGTQAADGITQLGKAGITSADILNGGLKGALSLAAAGQLDVGEAAETAASAMTQFKLSGDKVPHVADLLAAAAGKAQGSVHDMGYALNQSGLVASQFGLSIEDTTGALAEFANAGLTGSDAGTSLKTMLLALANPSKQTRDQMKDLGISFYDAKGQFIGVAGVAQVLQTKLKGLTEEQRNQALGQIFGNDAIRSASILYTDGAKGVEKWRTAVNDSGYAADTAATLTDNLAGDMERLKGSIETMAIEAGSGANGGLRSLAQAANAVVGAFSALPAPLQQAAVLMSATSGGALLAMTGFVKLRTTVTDFMTQLRDIGPTGKRVADGLGSIGGVAGKLGLVGLAVGGVFEGFQLLGNWMEKRSAPVKADIDGLTESVKQFAATGQVTGELAAKYGDHLQKIGQDVSAVTKGMADLKQAQADVAAGLSDPSVYANWNPVDPQAVQRVKDLDTALAGLVKAGGASQARIFMQQLASSGQLTVAQFQQLTSMLPGYSQAAGGAATANAGLAKGFGTASANANALTSSLDQAIAAGQTLTDVWNQLHGATLSTDKAMLEAENAISAVKDSFKQNKNAIDGNSASALKNRIAVEQAAEAAAKAAQAKLEETGSVKAANQVYDGYISQLRKTLGQSKVTGSEVQRLIGRYADMPSSVTTKVSITNAAAVEKSLSRLSAYQAALKRGVPVEQAILQTDRGKMRFADGGWTGPGSKYQPAGVVHADEFVIQKESRQKIEAKAPGLLDQMNTTGQVPGYAGGGQVWPFPTTAAMTRIPTRAQALAAIGGALGGSAGGGSLGAWIARAITLTGVPASWGGPLRTLVMRESGGNPRAINLWDSNAKAGHPSKGLAQTIPSTFEHYRLRSLPDDIYNPVANLAAAIRYIESRYGTIFRVQQANKNLPPKGYAGGGHVAMAHGGTITEPIMGVGASGRTYSFGENYQPERVVPNWQTDRSGGRAVTVNLTFSGPVGSQYELQNWLTGALDDLKRRGRF